MMFSPPSPGLLLPRTSVRLTGLAFRQPEGMSSQFRSDNQTIRWVALRVQSLKASKRFRITPNAVVHNTLASFTSLGFPY